MGEWYDALGLKPRELTILRGAINSILIYGIADFLPPTGKGSQNAALRLIERGYLTRSATTLKPLGHGEEWIVVNFTEANRQKLLADSSNSVGH